MLHPFLVAFPHSKEKDDPDAGAVFAPIKRVFKIATAVFVSKAIGFIVCGGGIEMWTRVIGMGGARRPSRHS